MKKNSKEDYVREKLFVLLKEAYIYYLIIVNESKDGYKTRKYSIVKYAYYVVRHFENARDLLECDEKIIIDNEFFKSSPSGWYLDYFSKSNYYRTRDKAYKRFIDYLN